MDVALGVAVTDRVARLALVDSAAPGTVIDQFVLDVAEHPVEVLTETVVGTDRSLAGENHRLVATRLCWPDQAKADELQHALQDSGVHDVAVISEAQAATALVGAAHAGSAVLLVGDETATLSVVGDPDAPPTMVAVAPVAGADATSTVDTLMARLGDQALAPGDVFLVGRSAEHTTVLADQLRAASTMRVQTPDDPTFALARGAAMAAGAATMAHPALVADATTSLPPAEAGQSGSEGEQLAYSQASDYELLPVDEYEEHDEYGAAADRSAPLSRRSLLIGNAVVAFAVIGFASLAVAVAVTIRPTAASKPVEGHQNAQPGKFMPLLPTQQQAPVPPPPPDDPTAGFQGGTIPAVQNVVPRPGTSPGVGGTPASPAPEAPAVPGRTRPAVTAVAVQQPACPAGLTGPGRPVGAVADQRPPQQREGGRIDRVQQLLLHVGGLGARIRTRTRGQRPHELVVKRRRRSAQRLILLGVGGKHGRHRRRHLIGTGGQQRHRRGPGRRIGRTDSRPNTRQIRRRSRHQLRGYQQIRHRTPSRNPHPVQPTLGAANRGRGESPRSAQTLC